jgi:hypothetical protein
MLTKLIAVVFIVLVLFGAYKLVMYYDYVQNQKEEEEKAAQAKKLNPGALPGVTWQLERSLQQAEEQGASALGNWLRTNGPRIQDPRKAWVELDYCVMLARDNPAEARRIFADVKARTPANSPIMPRIKELEKTYE